MMRRSISKNIVLLLLLIYLTKVTSGSNNSGVEFPKIMCKETERRALLKIKDDLRIQDVDKYVLSSWREEEAKSECCEWIGIRCENRSGHVVALDLSLSILHANDSIIIPEGNISSSLLNLQHLTHLDLSGFDFFDQALFPSFIGGLSKLSYLNLSNNFLTGEVPPQLGNLSDLQFLDLRNNFDLTIKNLEWVSRLSSLRFLDLSSTIMNTAYDWLRVVNSLPYLTTVRLSECSLPSAIPPESLSLNASKSLVVLDLSSNPELSNATFTWLFNYSRSLVYLDISQGNYELSSIPEGFRDMVSLTYLNLWNNHIHGSIPEFFGNMTSLVYLDLRRNNLEGHIPESFGNLTSLKYLYLAYNMLEGEIPKHIWEICTLQDFQAQNNNLSGPLWLSESSSGCDHFSLEYLDLTQNRIAGSLQNFTLYPSLKEIHLSSNQLDGNVSESLGQLSQLEILDISENHVESLMSDVHFSKLFNLRYLDLSSNSRIVLNIPSDWIPPFQLSNINLGSCKLGPHFPRWLRTQKSYTDLNISRSGISDFVPSWFWNNPPLALRNLDLSNNAIVGTILGNNSSFSNGIFVEIDLSSNQFEGSIPPFLLQVYALDLSKNRISDLNSICNITVPIPLNFLDVSYNQLSGELPNCWSPMKRLQILILGDNKLTGKIPVSIGFMTSIETLHLANNEFTGELPESLENCTELMVFDIGGNKLSGEIPPWIGKSVEKLIIFSLRYNDFYGSLPKKLCQLGNLQVLDLSSNNLSSSIPTCLGNITAMRQIESVVHNIQHLYDYRGYPGFLLRYNDKLKAQWKGSLSEFQNLGLLKNMDLSSNKLTSEIPRDITELIGLVSLNLSRNNLSGRIPQEIGRMESLDALDLSHNRLFGEIPSSLSQIDRLNALDLSSNNLSGKIPRGTQLQNRDASAYTGNPQLCGAPLSKKCPGEEEPTTVSEAAKNPENGQEKDEIITKGFYISTAIGFIVAFWVTFGTLIFKMPGRLLRIIKS